MSRSVYALFGDPVAQSLSPLFQNAAFAAAGLDAEYVAMRVEERGLAEAVARVRSGEIAGANVTIPHKRSVLALCDELRPEAREVRAVNWLGLVNGKLVGDNTDAEGLIRALEESRIPVARSKVLLLGAGGAARAAVVALLRLGASTIFIAARRRSEAMELAAEHKGASLSPITLEDSRRGAIGSRMKLIVSAVPPSAWAEVAPLETGRDAVAVDLAYDAAGTAMQRWADARGMPSYAGREMLLHQGALSFEKWTGVPFPMEAARAALG